MTGQPVRGRIYVTLRLETDRSMALIDTSPG